MWCSVEWPQSYSERAWKNIGNLHVHREKQMGLVTTSQSLSPFPSAMCPTPVFSCLRPAVIYPLTQGLANNRWWARSNLWPVFANQVLLKHSRAHVFTYCIWILSCPVATKPKLFTTWIFKEKNVMTPAKMPQLSRFQNCAVLSLPSESFPVLLLCPRGSACYTGPTSRGAHLWRRVPVC